MDCARSSLAGSLACLLVLGPACGSDHVTSPTPPRTTTNADICQAGLSCCTAEELVCSGDVDTEVTCACFKSWTCESGLNPRKCWQQPPVFPDGNGGWSCRISGAIEQCQREGGDVPPGKNEWTCFQAGELGVCGRSTHTPSGSGSWSCSYANDVKTCVQQVPLLDASPPTPDGSSPPRADGGPSDGRVVPSDAGVVPVEVGIVPPPPTECIPGQRKWCDGTIYCGWGQTTCGPDGKWLPGCTELPDGRRPNTTCACYFLYWNPECCERPDCLVPTGTNGQICSPSSGEYCAYCNPSNPECKGAGAKCIVTTSNEAFCGMACSGGACPNGSRCLLVEVEGEGHDWQCVPNDLSCAR